MSKKKRNKQYKGSVSTRPTITRVSAVNRNPVHQWWVDRKQAVRPMVMIGGIAIVVVIVIIGIVGIFVH